jgi:hypothetical protein
MNEQNGLQMLKFFYAATTKYIFYKKGKGLDYVTYSINISWLYVNICKEFLDKSFP